MWPFGRKQKNITVDVSIDYEKLAKEIVKAQQEAERQKTRPNRFRGSIMSGINAVLYGVISLFSGLMAISVWVESIAVDTFAKVLYTILFAFVTISCGACAAESMKDTDENAQQHFNTNITLIALIVALVALFKGVG